MAKLKLSPPWVIYYHEVSALFAQDKTIKVVLDEDNYRLNIYIDDRVKAAALTELLPVTKEFGGVTLEIAVIPSNADPNNVVKISGCGDNYVSEMYKTVFRGNPTLAYCRVVDGPFEFPATFVVFEKSVVQYFIDALNDANGVCSTLYQEIAKDVFQERPGVYFCTAVEEPTVFPF